MAISDRYFITSRNFGGAIVWYVKEQHVLQDGAVEIIARCSNEAAAKLCGMR